MCAWASALRTRGSANVADSIDRFARSCSSRRASSGLENDDRMVVRS
jgi:hypothetical protein